MWTKTPPESSMRWQWLASVLVPGWQSAQHNFPPSAADLPQCGVLHRRISGRGAASTYSLSGPSQSGHRSSPRRSWRYRLCPQTCPSLSISMQSIVGRRVANVRSGWRDCWPSRMVRMAVGTASASPSSRSPLRCAAGRCADSSPPLPVGRAFLADCTTKGAGPGLRVMRAGGRFVAACLLLRPGVWSTPAVPCSANTKLQLMQQYAERPSGRSAVHPQWAHG